MTTDVIRIWYQTVSSKKNFPETLKSYQQDLGSFAGPGVEIEVHGLPEGGLADQTVQGLPVAFQLIGRSFDERLLLGAACAYERETAWASIVSPVEQHNRTMQAKCP